MGDIHHFAWRARLRNQTVYIVPRDGERFGSWNKVQCMTEDCIEVKNPSPYVHPEQSAAAATENKVLLPPCAVFAF